jgi:hypothetical protein
MLREIMVPFGNAAAPEVKVSHNFYVFGYAKTGFYFGGTHQQLWLHLWLNKSWKIVLCNSN